MHHGMSFWAPYREYITIAVLVVALPVHLFVVPIGTLLLLIAAVSAVPLAIRALLALADFRITLDVFNVFAVSVSLAVGEVASAVFIMLMITSADLLEWHTSRRTQNAVEELLKLKPQTAIRERENALETIPATRVQIGDIVIVESGQSVPVDGVVVNGRALVNESLVTGESMPVEKNVGSSVLVSTTVDIGAIRVRATHVGKDSTIERMAELMRSALLNKSKPERLADRFAMIFLPIIIVFGAGVYFVTHNILMTVALFMVACTDDIAVAVPLAMTASLGWAAKRGVIVKGGAWLDTLARARTLVLDKTGTLTYGNFRLDRLALEPGVDADVFWRSVGIAEKFSEHPIGRALFAQALQRVGEFPDPDDVVIHKGAGISAKIDGHVIAIGDEKLFQALKIEPAERIVRTLGVAREGSVGTSVFVLRDTELLGIISLADAPRPEAAQSIAHMRALGIQDILMFTGDNATTAQRVAKQLGISQVEANMKPEDKVRVLEQLAHRPVIMVGDGINDAPVLARADIGIAMGKGGTAIASEAADIIILNDRLDRLADLVRLGRRTRSVIRGDFMLWTVTNVIGYALVLTGVFGPALAAFYNFATDFVPLINSSRLFRSRT